ncbi:MAG: elongation factor G [Acidimicrobiia bacterium]|nr:elongation factor G [Acidimicrobiia bacterium]
MMAFATEKIRNVALVGSQGAGKTTLAEAMLYRAGMIDRTGSVEEGNTVCDFTPEEKAANHSQSLALVSFEWQGHKINLIDTPGAPDYACELHAALQVSDLLVFVIDASNGVDHRTTAIWHQAADAKLPRIVFVNKLDREHANFQNVLGELQETFGAGVAPLELPIGAGPDFHGIADLLTDKAYIYDSGAAEEVDIPADMEDQEAEVHEHLIEGIVVADDNMLEQYLEGNIPNTAQLEEVLSRGVMDGSVFPVVCGSATGPIAVDRLANFLVEIGPSPASHKITVTLNNTNSEIACDPDGDQLACVFKTISDDYVGQISLFRVLSGTIRRDDHLTNSTTGDSERLRGLISLLGGSQSDITEIAAGDIGGVTKLQQTRTGDTLTNVGRAVVQLDPWPTPVLAYGIVPTTRAAEDKLGTGLRRLTDEDPSLQLERNEETRQTLLWGLGDAHLRLAIARLERMGIDVAIEELRVPYRQTITGNGDAEGKHKKQSGGHGQFGIAYVRVEPLPRGTGFEFVDAVTGGSIPRQYIPAVEAGVRDAMTEGGGLRFPIVDVRATVYDGKHHSVDSSEFSFQMAGKLAFSAAFAQANPVVLEPMAQVEITVAAEYQGDVMGDLSSRRGQVQGTDTGPWGEQVVHAIVPEAELVRYAIELRSLTGGRASFKAERVGYEIFGGALPEAATA